MLYKNSEIGDTMKSLSKIQLFISVLFTIFVLNGCSDTVNEQSTISLRVIDSSSDLAKELIIDTEDYSTINVAIIRIELVGEDTVVVLEDYAPTPVLINLLDLGSAGNLLVDNTEILLGIYNKIRMILEAPEEQNQPPTNPSSYLTLDGDATEYPIFIPSGSQTGLKVNLTPNIGLVDGSSFEIVFDFNSENTIKKTGQNDRYIIRPTSMSATVTDNS
jgi:hypothetical protein